MHSGTKYSADYTKLQFSTQQLTDNYTVSFAAFKSQGLDQTSSMKDYSAESIYWHSNQHY